MKKSTSIISVLLLTSCVFLDYREIKRLRDKAIRQGKNPEFVDRIFDPDLPTIVDGQNFGDTFPDRINPKDIITAPAYRHPIDQIVRLGGLLINAGKKIDLDKIKWV